MAVAAILHESLETIGACVESKIAGTNWRFDFVQSLKHVTRLYCKAVCKVIQSTPNLVRIEFYKKYKLQGLHQKKLDMPHP